MNKDYVNKKIENCQELVNNATSEAQKEIYQSYLDLWTKKLPVKDRPEAKAKKAEAEQKKLEVAAAKKEEAELLKKVIEGRRIEDAKAKKAEKIAAKKAELAALEAEEAEIIKTVADQKPVEIVIIEADPADLELLEEAEYANIFEIENPGKKAYRTQNGDRIKTIAFKEFLNQRTQ